MKYLNEFILYMYSYYEAIFFHPTSRLAIKYIFLSVIIAFIFYLFNEVRKGKKKWEDFFGYFFSKKIYFHPSAIMDYKIIAASILIPPSKWVMGFISASFLGQLTYDTLKGIYNPIWPKWEVNTFSILTAGFLGLMAIDFVNFISHYWAHKRPFLWRLHSLHHSAEVMTPFTNLRNHPLYVIYRSLLSSMIIPILGGVFAYLTFNGVDMKFFINTSAGVIIFNALGANLRHTHVWISYPKFLSKIFISPAMHQIHHSLDMKHRNKNMGVIFSFWDRMFGTLYIPTEKEDLKFGISKETPNPHKSLKDAYITSILKG
jgi:sterol desaturase/sphingolipid hydroxylase (fatty acid hydroxylase superfamily)